MTDWPNLIRQARERLGESQAEFATRFAVTPNTVSRWESGTYKISLEAVDWLLTYISSKTLQCCPTCGGKGLIEEVRHEVQNLE